MDVTELAMLLDTMDIAPVDARTFMAAAEKVKKFKLDDEQKLQLYGLFKQSSVSTLYIMIFPLVRLSHRFNFH